MTTWATESCIVLRVGRAGGCVSTGRENMSKGATFDTRRSKGPAHRVRLGLAALLVVGVASLTNDSSARAGTVTGTPIFVDGLEHSHECNSSVPVTAGNFLITCSGTGAALVSVKVTTTSCASSSGPIAGCEISFQVIKSTRTNIAREWSNEGAMILQSQPLTVKSPPGANTTSTVGTTGSGATSGSTGAAGTTGSGTTTSTAISSEPPLEEVSLNFRTIEMRYIFVNSHGATRVFTVTLRPTVGHALSDPSVGIQDTKNVADGAAKSQPVE